MFPPFLLLSELNRAGALDLSILTVILEITGIPELNLGINDASVPYISGLRV